jgi:hypothetical protein
MRKNTAMKKLITILFIVLLAFKCSPEFVSKFNHDKYNPCSIDQFHDSIECERWKKLYPKEYARYKERQKTLAKGS